MQGKEEKGKNRLFLGLDDFFERLMIIATNISNEDYEYNGIY